MEAHLRTFHALVVLLVDPQMHQARQEHSQVRVAALLDAGLHELVHLPEASVFPRGAIGLPADAFVDLPVFALRITRYIKRDLAPRASPELHSNLAFCCERGVAHADRSSGCMLFFLLSRNQGAAD